MAMARPKRKLVNTGVTLEVHVRDYLDELALADERDRSFMINRIVREYARTQGVELSPNENKTTRRVNAAQ